MNLNLQPEFAPPLSVNTSSISHPDFPADRLPVPLRRYKELILEESPDRLQLAQNPTSGRHPSSFKIKRGDAATTAFLSHGRHCRLLETVSTAVMLAREEAHVNAYHVQILHHEPASLPRPMPIKDVSDSTILL
jgi:hypothetical protein